MKPTPQKLTSQEKKCLVQVSIKGGKITYYFTTRVEAEIFFNDYCKQMSIDCAPLLTRHTYARETRPEVIVDFEQITELNLQIIFNLN